MRKKLFQKIDDETKLIEAEFNPQIKEIAKQIRVKKNENRGPAARKVNTVIGKLKL